MDCRRRPVLLDVIHSSLSLAYHCRHVTSRRRQPFPAPWVSTGRGSASANGQAAVCPGRVLRHGVIDVHDARTSGSQPLLGPVPRAQVDRRILVLLPADRCRSRRPRPRSGDGAREQVDDDCRRHGPDLCHLCRHPRLRSRLEPSPPGGGRRCRILRRGRHPCHPAGRCRPLPGQAARRIPLCFEGRLQRHPGWRGDAHRARYGACRDRHLAKHRRAAGL